MCRIMLEEHGYNRSGKKCREKFENLYKYYKKTKDGKSGRQDGKNYRFFRQLEAIYGESSASSSGININRCSAMELANNQLPYDWQLDHQHNKHNQEDYCESISFSISNSSTRDQQLEASSNDSEKIKKLQHVGGGDDECGGGRNQRSKGWREKVKGFVDSEMRRLVERQDTWMDGMSKTIERREQERAWREVEWRRQETARFDREHEQWAKERAWIEARDAALMEALKKFARNNDEHPINASRLSISKNNNNNDDDRNDIDGAGESETWSLVQLRTGLEWSFQECGGYSSEGLWEAMAARMASLGYNLNGAECKEKWESIRASFSKI
ncbi:hypothetical protein SAY86_010242 [Trapa natans]|uniref:Myb/SANT-like DNA-binding domain-containing protein n=1 Tax=Trapa natans TaxID=22666 RepID=A0AAN7QQY1_TRANT|nr:hypothetical protein SAY86_010242 [Trapa natans]